MKTTMSKHLLLTLSIVLSFTLMLSACNSGDPDTSPSDSPDATPTAGDASSPPPPQSEKPVEPEEPKMTDGYFFFAGPATADLPCFVRFNEDGSYYASYFNGAILEAGQYEVFIRDMDYISDPGADGEFGTADDAVATANQVVVLTNYSTGATQEIAFDGGTLFDFTLGGMAGHITMSHMPDYAYDPEIEEMPIAVQVFYYQNDTGSSLTLYHNRTFNDFTTAWEEGTWIMENGVFKLSESGGASYTLTVSENGMMATYVKGGDTLEMTSTTREYVYSFTAVAMPDGLPMEVDIALNCKPDGTAQLVISHPMMGEFVVDTGTYSVANMVFILFELEHGGSIMGEPDFESASEEGITINVAYIADTVIGEGDGAMPISIDCILSGLLTM